MRLWDSLFTSQHDVPILQVKRMVPPALLCRNLKFDHLAFIHPRTFRDPLAGEIEGNLLIFEGNNLHIALDSELKESGVDAEKGRRLFGFKAFAKQSSNRRDDVTAVVTDRGNRRNHDGNLRVQMNKNYWRPFDSTHLGVVSVLSLPSLPCTSLTI